MNCLPGWQENLSDASQYVRDPAYGNYPVWTCAPQATVPDLAVAQPMMMHGAQGPGFAAPQRHLRRDMQHAAPQEAPPAPSGEDPTYVNSKQFHRILKRRVARQRFKELFKPRTSRKAYLHKSRHNHASRRPRNADGRFLTAEKYAEYKRELESEDQATRSRSRPNPKDMAMPGMVEHQKGMNVHRFSLAN